MNREEAVAANAGEWWKFGMPKDGWSCLYVQSAVRGYDLPEWLVDAILRDHELARRWPKGWVTEDEFKGANERAAKAEAERDRYRDMGCKFVEAVHGALECPTGSDPIAWINDNKWLLEGLRDELAKARSDAEAVIGSRDTEIATLRTLVEEAYWGKAGDVWPDGWSDRAEAALPALKAAV